MTQTIPAGAEILDTIEDELDVERSIDIYYTWNDGKPTMGGKVTFFAVMHGYDNMEYTIQWQESANGDDWMDVSGETGQELCKIITRENYKNYWRVQVMIAEVEA